MQHAEDLSRKTEERLNKRRTVVNSKARVKGVEQWGGRMFCQMFYTTLVKYGIECRDAMDGNKVFPRYEREMGRFLDIATNKGYTKKEILDAFTRVLDNWDEGFQRKFCGERNLSVYDLRYHMDLLFGNKLPARASTEPVDLSGIYEEDSNEG